MAPVPAAPTRQPAAAEAVAVPGDDGRVGMGEGDVERGRPAAVDGHGPADERRRAARRRRGRGPDVAAHRLADGAAGSARA